MDVVHTNTSSRNRPLNGSSPQDCVLGGASAVTFLHAWVEINVGGLWRAYDPSIKTMVTPTARTGDVTTDYDLTGNVLLVSWPGSSVASVYDSAGRRTRETTVGPGGALAISTRYDKAGNRTHVIWGNDLSPPSLSGLTFAAYEYNYDNSLKAITGSGGEALTSFAYDELGRLTSAAAGNGTSQTYQFRANNGLLEQIRQDGFAGGAKIWQNFDYNPAGQIVSQSQSNPNLIWTGQPNKTTSQTYNGLNQDSAVASLAGGSCAAAGAGYDCNGNLLVDVEAVTNATRTYGYDAENRLTQVAKVNAGQTTTLALTYDPLGRLLTTTAGTVTTRFLYDGDRLVGEYDGSLNRLRRYVHGAGVDNPLVWYEGSGEADKRWLHVDRQGSVIGYSLTDKSLSTYAYGPYGEAQSWAGSRFRYTGQIALPEVELYHYKARAYDPRIGRFLQTDPTGYDDGLNWYAYVGNDPLNLSDPTGLQCDTGSRVGGQGSSCQSDNFLPSDEGGGSGQRERSTASRPGTLESLIPVWGAGREAYADFSEGDYLGATVNGAIAVSDVIIVKAVVTGVARGAFKLGSHAWGPTRAWMGRQGYLKPGQHGHHWAIPRNGWGKSVPDVIKNQPWNIKPMKSPQFHTAVHGKGRNAFGPVGRVWHGTPAWAKAVPVTVGGRVSTEDEDHQ